MTAPAATRRPRVPEDARPTLRTVADELFDPPPPAAAQPAEAPTAASYDPPTSRPLVLATLHYHGVPVQLDIRAIDAETLDQIERRIARLLKREGWTSPPAPAAAAPARPARPAELRQEPLYQPDGTPCCPIHKKPLKAGQHGYYCSAKAEPPYANDKGYCLYAVKEV